MNTHEGGTIPEENLTNYNVDRVKTFGEAMLGLTLGCCSVPRPQVRPAHAARLLPNLRLLQHAQRRRPRRQRRRELAAASTKRKPCCKRARNRSFANKSKRSKKNSPIPPKAMLSNGPTDERLRLSSRGKDLKLHPVELLNVSTPNNGKGFDIEPPRFVHIIAPVRSGRVRRLDPSAQNRQAYHRRPRRFPRDPKTPGGGRGYGTLPWSAEPRRTANRRTRGCRSARGTYERHVRSHGILRQRRTCPRRPGESQPPARCRASYCRFLAAGLSPRKCPRHSQ